MANQTIEDLRDVQGRKSGFGCCPACKHYYNWKKIFWVTITKVDEKTKKVDKNEAVAVLCIDCAKDLDPKSMFEYAQKALQRWKGTVEKPGKYTDEEIDKKIELVRESLLGAQAT